MKKRIAITRTIEIFFMVLFLYTGIYKLADHASFEGQLTPILPSHQFVILVAWLVPGMELSISVLLWLKKTRSKGLYLSGILMLLFSIYLIVMAYTTPNLSCGCGGIIDQLSFENHLVFNSLCMVLSVAGICIRQRNPNSTININNPAGDIQRYISQNYPSK